MSVTLRELRSRVQGMIELDNTNEMNAAINWAIRRVASMQDWDALVMTSDVTPSSGVIVAPVLARKITQITTTRDNTTWPSKFMAAPRKPVAPGLYDVIDRFVPYGTSTTITQDDLTVSGTVGEFTFSQTAGSAEDIPAGCVGEMISVAGDDQVYEITAVSAATSVTVRPAIAKTTTGASAWIGTSGLRQYILYDTDNAVTDATTVTVEYQRVHPILALADDRMLIDAPSGVALRAIQYLESTSRYNVVAANLANMIIQADAEEIGRESTRNRVVQRKPDNFRIPRRYTTRWRR